MGEIKTGRLRRSTRDLFRLLCAEKPQSLPVTLIAKHDEECLGKTRILVNGPRGPRYVIWVRPDMDEIMEHETLVHEYAHVMTMSYCGDHHDAVWGVAYAECYRTVFGEH